MSDALKNDRQRFSLSESDSEAIFRVRVVPEYFVLSDDRPSQPTAVILGGQPGAGKSLLLHEARAELSARGATVVINGDDLRPYHPEYARLQREAPEWAAFYTDHDSGRWVEKTIAEGRSRGVNLVIESTMRNPDTFERTAALLREAGYRIEARALAVPAADSWLGVNQRYEAMLAAGGFARWTLPESHDAGFHGVPQTLRRIEERSLADRVAVYTRDGQALYENTAGPQGQWLREPRAADALEAERGREATRPEAAARLAAWGEIARQMEARGLPEAQIRQTVDHMPAGATGLPLNVLLNSARAAIAAEQARIEGGRDDLNRLNTDRLIRPAERVNEAMRVEAEMRASLHKAEVAWGRVYDAAVAPEVSRLRTEAADQHRRASTARDLAATELERLERKGPEQGSLTDRLRERLSGQDGQTERQKAHAEAMAGALGRRDSSIREVNQASATMRERADGKGPIGAIEQRALNRLAERDHAGTGASSAELVTMWNSVSSMRQSVRVAGEFVAQLQAERLREREATTGEGKPHHRADRQREPGAKERERE